MYIVFDTETTGLPDNFKAPITDTDNWPRCIQIAWQIHDEMGRLVEAQDFLIQPDGFDIPYDSEKIHGISTALAQDQGIPLDEVLDKFQEALSKSKFIVGHNVLFDINIMGCELYRRQRDLDLTSFPVLDTCTEKSATFVGIKSGNRFKLPTLTELHEKLFDEAFGEAHNATADVEATTRCFLEMIRIELFPLEDLQQEDGYFQQYQEINKEPIKGVGLDHLNLKEESAKYVQGGSKGLSEEEKKAARARLKEVPFAHLHNHSQFSILQSTSTVNDLVATAAKMKMPAVALTDSGNMMATFHFVRAAFKHNRAAEKANQEAIEKGEEPTETIVKPITGCEFFVCNDRNNKSFKDNGYQVVMLAKNRKGYHNIAKMASIAYIEGQYYVPRIDKEVVKQYAEDVICLTGGLNGEVPGKILNVGTEQAEEALLWYKDVFGDDLYIELNNHGQDNEKHVNQVLIELAQKHEVKLLACNNTFYIKKEDAVPHDILLCVKEGEKKDTPIGRGRGFRFGFPNDEYYFKSQDEMKELFLEVPEAIENIGPLVDQIEAFELERDILLPAFDIPEKFVCPEDEEDGGKRGENKYLRHLTYEGAKVRYGKVSPSVRERLDFELAVIANTGYPGYFLIVQDFCQAARDMGVSVGPGRGSAAGSAVAYCIGITNVDPIAYDLLFERFLNPDRVSMPDIDIDFDDEGRGDVIQFVIDKYGSNQVAQIITYGTMAAKSSVRDTARVLDLPLNEADELAKLIPDISLSKLFNLDDKALKDKLKGNAEDVERAEQLKRISQGNDLKAKTINQARILEGSVRNTGIHACGVIITPDDITKFVPVATAKDSDMVCTQFDNSVAEDAGLLKMDFLGLKTLTLIKHACRIVKERHGVELDPENFPIDDEKTYELFQRGETVGIFQYESAGMQKYMKELKPTVFADLIAMNALYRPGPLEYIPSFIKRKHGIEEIVYDIPASAEYLAETYGITVYQEQVMLLSQSLADFTKGEADTLRKAMGKKKFDLLAMLKPKFLDQGEANGHDRKKLEKVWKDWEAFAAYAFNKSHSTCYAWVAYQTAYLKAHYPAEYMASVLSNNMNDIKQVSFFMDECRRMGVTVLGPDVNESRVDFTVNAQGEIRFGMAAMKGVGAGAVEHIIEVRENEGAFKSVFDLTAKVDLKSVNKRVLEALAQGGAMDSFGQNRSAYFGVDHKNNTVISNAIKYGISVKEGQNSSQASLFGDSDEVDVPEPTIPDVDEWGALYKLNKEKEVVGIYISGHPLDDYKLEFDHFCNTGVAELADPEKLMNRPLCKIAGMVTAAEIRVSKKNGNPYGVFTVEDYSGAHEFWVFGESFLRIREFIVPELFVYMEVGVSTGWGDNPKPRVDVNKMEMLSNLRDKVAKKITYQIELDKIDDYMVEQFTEVLKKYEGNVHFNLKVVDFEQGVSLNMYSRKYRIELSNGFLKSMEEMQCGQFIIE